jgi:transcriptional regulator with XRE-family HTH domain
MKVKLMNTTLDEDLEIFYKIIGVNVKNKRNEKGLSQLRLSEEMNFKSVGFIGQAELYMGKRHFNLSHLYQLASILECDIEEFFKDVKIVPKSLEI